MLVSNISLCPMWCFINWCHFWWSILSNINKCTLDQSMKSNIQRTQEKLARPNSWRFSMEWKLLWNNLWRLWSRNHTKSECISVEGNFHWKTMASSTIVIIDWPLSFCSITWNNRQINPSSPPTPPYCMSLPSQHVSLKKCHINW